MVKLNLEIPEDFFLEEKRCGYVISEEMKKIWAVELDLLNELLNVCKKHNITIFASGGTMLGAVRHGGFIPWDDDIDMMMFREDYDKLCSIADKEFKKPYFFQTEFTDPGSLRGHAQLRNSDTTGILKAEQGRYKFNQGIFIDIFPLDSVVENDLQFRIQWLKASWYKFKAYAWGSISNRYYCKKGIDGLLRTILHRTVNKVLPAAEYEVSDYKKHEDTCKKYNNKMTKYISSLSFQFADRQHFKYRNDYTELIDMEFEFLVIPVGKNYDHALKTRYGDYMKYEMNTSCHGGVFFDTDNSYEKYINSI